jgi:hypothetical protein
MMMMFRGASAAPADDEDTASIKKTAVIATSARVSSRNRM